MLSHFKSTQRLGTLGTALISTAVGLVVLMDGYWELATYQSLGGVLRVIHGLVLVSLPFIQYVYVKHSELFINFRKKWPLVSVLFVVLYVILFVTGIARVIFLLFGFLLFRSGFEF